MNSSSLVPGSTQTLQVNPQKAGNLKSQPTNQKSTGLRGAPTKMGGIGQKTKLAGGTSKQQTTVKQEQSLYVKEGGAYVTPKPLISKAIEEMSVLHQTKVKENMEKEKNDKLKRSASQYESQSIMQSADKSSNSDYKMSSSGVKDSSFQQSQRSENTESEDDSKGKNDNKDEKKGKKQKVLTEEEKNEQIIINLSETETQFLLFIPSSLIVSDATHSNVVTQKIIERNKNYERYVQERIGSDNYTSRAANTFNYAPKMKEQNSTTIERVEQSCYVANWDLYDAEQQEQLKEYEILQEDIRRNIEKDLKTKLRDPFCLLPVDVRAIKLHKEIEVPGSHLIYEQLKPKGTKGLGGQTSQATSGVPHGSTQLNAYTSQGDETNKDTSERIDDQSGSKFTRTNQDGKGVSKNLYGLGKGESVEQMQRQAKLLQEKILQDEKKMFQEIMQNSFEMPSEEEQIIMNSEKLATNLKYVDRILNQNSYHKQYISYRNYPEVKIQRMAGDDDKNKAQRRYNKQNEDEEKEKKQETLNELFRFKCDLTKDRAVSCADWNPINKDLLAVTYGEYDLNVNQPGYVMFWTLKNPSYPERILKTNTRLMSCKFSQQNPNLLATGSYDGVVSIYDLRKKDGIPVAENKEHREKHSDVIWEVQWAAKGSKNSDKGEGLISISADGRVCEWSMKKGLDLLNLMNLKRSSPPGSKENNQEGVNFREVAGMSIDFLKGESSMYLVATDDGAIHRCSKSYTEQYLDSFFGHSGPVYRVRCNPFNSDIFLTCSADWSCKLWNIKAPEQQNPICNFLNLDLFDEVMDIEWNPHISTVFASVCKDGRLELWDIEKNSMDPIHSTYNKGVQQSEKTVVRFGLDAPIIVTGDVEGDLTVFRVNGYEDYENINQQQKLDKVLQQQGYSKGKGEKGEHD